MCQLLLRLLQTLSQPTTEILYHFFPSKRQNKNADLNRELTSGENLNITAEVAGAAGVVSKHSRCNDSGLNLSDAFGYHWWWDTIVMNKDDNSM